MARSFVQRRSSGRPRRPMDWEYALIVITAIAASTKAAAQVVTSTELNAEYTDPTLMATRMVCGVPFAAASTSGSVVGIGLIAWDDINNTVPTAAELPGPLSNGNLDWIIRQVFVNPGGGSVSVNSAPGDETITSRARRRLGSSRTLLLVAETNSTAVTSNGLIVDVRCLIKE